MTEKALRELASILNHDVNLSPGETPLLIAVGLETLLGFSVEKSLEP
ncbi:MAG: hypothetical protein AB4372_04965 [Xenococcus sp. (in: cyanobacteria)]